LASVFPLASPPVLALPFTSTFASVFPFASVFFLPSEEEESEEESDPFLASVFPFDSVLAPPLTSTFASTLTLPPTFMPPLALPLASVFFPESELDPEEDSFLASVFPLASPPVYFLFQNHCQNQRIRWLHLF